jgi:DNA polymerase-3 subunit chi
MSAAGRTVEHWFYHLERSSLADALPPMLEKARAKGWRAFVRVGSAARLDELDDVLWTYRDEAFLPHGRADQPGAERQPILLSRDDAPVNGAELVVLLDSVFAPDLSKAHRCVIMFDGADEDAVHAARQTWKSLKAAGAAMSYWRQTPDGGWREGTG